MSGFSEVHWAEGMFLQPHHLQLSQRHLLETIGLSADGLQPFYWGVRRLEVDDGALENFTVSIPRCDVRLPDGTEVRVPENADLPELDVREAMEKEPGKPLEIRLGVPLARPRGGNLARLDGKEDDGLPRRYRVTTQEVADENTGEDPRALEVRRLNARLYLPGQEAIEYSSTIPILNIVRSGEDEFLPRLDPDFVSPTIALEGSPRLQALARDVLHLASARSSALARIISTQQIDFGVEAGGSPEMMLKMHVLNGFLAFYQQFLQIPRLHPLSVFCVLCRLAGELAIFTERRQAPRLPRYEHDDPGPCFRGLFEILEGLLRAMYIARVRPTPFKPWGRFLVVSLNPEWFEAGSTFYVGVDSTLGREEVLHILQKQVSIGSKSTIENLARRVLLGIRRWPEDRTPVALPERAQRVYFRLDRKGGDEELTVGTEELAIFNGSGKDLEFNLFVVTREDKHQLDI